MCSKHTSRKILTVLSIEPFPFNLPHSRIKQSYWTGKSFYTKFLSYATFMLEVERLVRGL